MPPPRELKHKQVQGELPLGRARQSCPGHVHRCDWHLMISDLGVPSTLVGCWTAVLALSATALSLVEEPTSATIGVTRRRARATMAMKTGASSTSINEWRLTVTETTTMHLSSAPAGRVGGDEEPKYPSGTLRGRRDAHNPPSRRTRRRRERLGRLRRRTGCLPCLVSGRALTRTGASIRKGSGTTPSTRPRRKAGRTGA
jgi:hypothetical protein